MKNLLYIGNKLSKNKTVTTIDTLGSALKNEGYNLTYASSFNNPLIRLVHMCVVVFREKKRADYVLIDTYSTLNFYYAVIVSLLCRWFSLKYIPILHGGNLPNRLKNSPKLSKAIFKNAYANIAPSNYTKQAFKNYGYTNVSCISNTIHIKNYIYTPKKVETVKLLWVRSFSKIYNPKLAVAILIALKAKGVKATLTMVGPEKDGTLAATKHYAKQNNVAVTFTGKLPKKEWLGLARHHNIFINTTNFDNMPVSVIEAMALGLPVISTNVGGIPFLIDANKDGVLVPPNSVSHFLESILKLKNNPEITQSIIEKARKKAESFDWEVVKEKWIKVLK